MNRAELYDNLVKSKARIAELEARMKLLEEADANHHEAHKQWIVAIQEADARVKDLEATLNTINDIRNSIIGLQAINWSEHIYPLVAALNDAGMEGMDYPEARKYFGTTVKRTIEAETDRDRYRADCAVLRQALERAAIRFNLIACGVSKETANPKMGAKDARQALSDHPGDRLLANYELVKSKLHAIWPDDCMAAKNAKEAFFAALED